MKERRESLRRRTYLGGRIEIAKLNGWATGCLIRNVSDAGARIEIPHDVVVPTHFHLGIVGEPPLPVRLVWYREGQAGVALGET